MSGNQSLAPGRLSEVDLSLSKRRFGDADLDFLVDFLKKIELVFFLIEK